LGVSRGVCRDLAHLKQLKPSLLDLVGLIVCPTCDDWFWTGSRHAEM
jgi:hypothetical protein